MTPPAVIIPAWPRGLDLAASVAYSGLTPAHLPKPSVTVARRRLWYREDLDRHLNQLAGRSSETVSADEWADVQP